MQALLTEAVWFLFKVNTCFDSKVMVFYMSWIILSKSGKGDLLLIFAERQVFFKES